MGRHGWGWPSLTMACLIVVTAAAVGNLSPLPVATHTVLLLLAGAAIGYGALSRRWRIALVPAAAASTLAVAGFLDLLPAGVDTVYRGPATSLAPRAAWTATVVVIAFNLAVALHTRRRCVRTPESPSDETPLVRQRLDALTERIAAAENATRR
jgi:hypothetical protein